MLTKKIVNLFIILYFFLPSYYSYAQNNIDVYDSNKVFSREPRLLYTDLVSAPQGAFVTIWGQNIPKDAKLTCGNETCKILSFEYDLNHPSHGKLPPRQKIVVRFNSGTDITLNGSNTLPFEINDGKIFEATPEYHLNTILDTMRPGDVLYLRGGKYKNIDPASYGYRKGFGSIIWATETRDGLAVVGYPGERVILDVSSGTTGFDTVGNIKNWTIANLECSGSGFAIGNNQGLCINAGRIGSRVNLRVVGMYNHDTGQNGCCAFGIFSNTSNLYILGNYSENTGTTSGKIHAIYHGGRGNNDNVNIDFNRIRNHIGRRGIQIYGHRPGEIMSNLNIRYNNIENSLGTDAILLSHSDSAPNVPPSNPERNWIQDALILGNTTHGGSGSGIAIRAAIADIIIRDNISYNNNQSIFIDFVKSAVIKNNCIDKEPYIRQKSKIILDRNKINYPDCLGY